MLEFLFLKNVIEGVKKALFIFQFSSSILFINDSNMTESG